MSADLKENEVVEDPELSNEQLIYNMNHSQRRRFIKHQLKKSEVPVLEEYIDANGDKKTKINGMTNQYKEVKRTEKNNIKNWMDRVARSQQAGKQIANRNTEIAYNKWKEEQEIIATAKLKHLFESYGEVEGQKMFDKWMKRVEKRATKKYGV